MPHLPILTFHALDDRADVIAFSPRLFQRAMTRLHEEGYRAVSLDEAVGKIRDNQPLPSRSFVLTFDDGYRSIFQHAAPVLSQYKMSATVFLVVGGQCDSPNTGPLPSLSDRPMLGWGEIREMANGGFSFGAHSLTHRDLTRLPPDRMKVEIVRSKTIIEDRLGSLVSSFAYPYGRYHRQSYAVVRQHFACACSDKLGLLRPQSDPYALERIDAYYLNSERLFEIMLSQWFPFYIEARSIPRRIRRVFST